jgi:hypothetical protein
MKSRATTSAITFAMMLGLACSLHAQEEPPLPEGLGESPPASSEEPPLPPGLESTEEPPLPSGLEPTEEPPLPQGLEEKTPIETEKEAPTKPTFELPFDLNGFWEARGGVRTQEDRYQKDTSIGETRLQLELEKRWISTSFKSTVDFLYDHIADDHDVHLEEGEGWIDLREANFSATPLDFVDIKFGRQILTWGTGDLIFINDLFPKDWNSFFIGRDDEYLKAPSDALKTSFFSDLANLDVVYTPRFDADRFIDGSRISYWNGGQGERAGRNAVIDADRPDNWLDDDEVAGRIYRTVSGWEVAVYGYEGFWKSPGGMDPASGKATFPRLAVYGASVRGNIARGIGNIELGYYDSKDDRDGDDPLVRNSELRFLVGYEQEIAKDFTAGIQYYLEHMMDHDDYRDALPEDQPKADENRSVFTLRLTRLLMSQNLKLSLFTYWSPTDEDVYLRPKVHYNIDDHWSAEMGGNIFIGEEDHTFFGQFEDNTNVYAGARYSF